MYDYQSLFDDQPSQFGTTSNVATSMATSAPTSATSAPTSATSTPSSNTNSATISTCNSETKEDKCKKDPVLNVKSALDACLEIREKAQDQESGFWGFAQNMVDTSRETIEDITDTIQAFASNAKSSSVNVTEIAANLSTASVLEQMSSCNALIRQEGSNIIEIDNTCTTDLMTIAADAGMEDLAKDIMEGSKLTVTGISQENTANAVSECKINIMMEALTTMDVSIDNEALQTAINEAKGIGSNSDSIQEVCQRISPDLSACKYMSQKQCCDSRISQTHSNMFKSNCVSGSISDVNQSSFGKARLKCDLGAISVAIDELAGGVTNKILQKAENSSEGVTLDGLLMIAALALFVFLGLPVMMGTKMTKGGVAGRGVMLALVGGGIIVFYHFWYGTQEYTGGKSFTKNKPHYACSATTIMEPPSEKSYGEVKKFLEDHPNDIVGYDFVMDTGGSDIDLDQVRDDQRGLAVFLTSVGNWCVYEEVITDDKASLSVVQARNPWWLLITGGALVACGGLMMLYGIFKKRAAAVHPVGEG